MKKSYLRTLITCGFLLIASVGNALQWGELEQQIKTTIEGLNLGRHSVETKYAEGSLTVSGYVSSTTEKTKVVEALTKLKGISEVVDELEVKYEDDQGKATSDDPLRKSALEAFKKLEGLGSYEVEIQAREGQLVLNGTVANARDRTRIAQAAQTVAGVKSVTNNLTVAPPPTNDEVETNVWQALQKNEDIDVDGITIKASNGIVTVRGQRGNHREIDRILSIVNMADGVTEVKSEMKVAK